VAGAPPLFATLKRLGFDCTRVRANNRRRRHAHLAELRQRRARIWPANSPTPARCELAPA